VTREALGRRIAGHAAMLSVLHIAARHGPPDGWVGAGFVRNAVWDWQHGREPDPARLNDLDLVFHDPLTSGTHWQARLDAAAPGLSWPGLKWEVTNQHGLSPAVDVAGAIALWPETATAVAARWVGGRVEVLAPHGLADLAQLLLRPTPAFRDRRAVLEARAAAKGWLAKWPGLRWA
jgi:uncharacterized protein